MHLNRDNILPFTPKLVSPDVFSKKPDTQEVKLKLMLLKYIDGMLRIAKQKNIELIFGGWDSDLYFSISKEYPTLTLPKWEWADFAHKADHPGIQAHKDYATYIHNKMFE